MIPVHGLAALPAAPASYGAAPQHRLHSLPPVTPSRVPAPKTAPHGRVPRSGAGRPRRSGPDTGAPPPLRSPAMAAAAQIASRVPIGTRRPPLARGAGRAVRCRGGAAGGEVPLAPPLPPPARAVSPAGSTRMRRRRAGGAEPAGASRLAWKPTPEAHWHSILHGRSSESRAASPAVCRPGGAGRPAPRPGRAPASGAGGGEPAAS